MDNKIISLCYVGNKLEKTTEVCRFADYISGRFVPFTFDPNKEFYDDERDLLVGANNDIQAEEGEICVYEWFSYLSDDKWRTNVKRRNDIPWCEVLYMDYIESPTQMIKMLKSGFQLNTVFDGKHDLVLVSKQNASGLNAVLLRKEIIKINKDTISLNADVIKVPVGLIDLRLVTESCQCRRSKFDKRRYLRSRDGFVEKKNYIVKEPVNVVKDIIQNNIGYFDSEVLSRKEKQLLRGIVSRVIEPTIVDLVCEKLECTIQEANDYIGQYIDAAKLKLDQQTAVSIIEKLIENDTDAVLQMKEAVKKEWLAENETLVANKQKEIEHYNDVLRTAEGAAREEKTHVQQEVNKEKGKLLKLETENAKLMESVNNLKQLKEDLEKEIQERLDRAKENLAGSMLDWALTMPVSQMPAPVSCEAQISKTFTIKYAEEETEKASVYDGHDVAQIAWNRICGDEDMASGLALIALAAFACNSAILVAGEGAEMIADILSASVYGQKPLKVCIRENTCLEDLIQSIELHNHQAICVINGLESGYAVARELMERFKDSRFIFTALHGESLAMEPESLFSTFFPVLTEYFYNGRYVQELSTLDCSEELMRLQESDQEKQAFKEAKRIVSKWLKEGFFAPLFKIRCARLIASMTVLAKSLDLNDQFLRATELELVLTPWLKCLRKTELLQPILEENNDLDDYKKKDILNYIGADGM